MATGAVALGLLGFGLTTRALRVKPEDPEGIALPAILGTILMSALAGGVSFTAGVLVLGPSVLPVLAGSLAIFAEGVVNIIQNLLFGQERLRRASAVMVLRRLITFAAVGIAAVVLGKSGADWIYVAMSLSSIAAVITCLALFPYAHDRPRMGIWKLIAQSRSYWAVGIWSMAQQLDVVIVGAILGSAPAAAFTAAFRLASPVHIVTSVVVARLIPVVSKRRALVEPKWPTGAKPYMIAAVAYSSVILISLPGLAYLAIAILGDKFAYAWWVFVLLFANSALSVMNQTLSAWIFAMERLTKWVPRLAALSTIVGLTIVVLACIAGSLTWAAAGTLSIQVLLLLSLIIAAVAERNYWRSGT